MIPGNQLSTPSPIYDPYLNPGDYEFTNLQSFSRGGVSIQDGSQGLDIQNWMLDVIVTGVTCEFYLSSPNQEPIVVLTRTSVTWARLTFDQNMNLFISYVDITGPHYYWFSPITHAYEDVAMDPAVIQPCCTMDDRRPQATQAGSNDIILSYLRDNSLYFRMQRDRYDVEYLLLSNVHLIIPNPALWNICMNEKYRLQFTLYGNLYG